MYLKLGMRVCPCDIQIWNNFWMNMLNEYLHDMIDCASFAYNRKETKFLQWNWDLPIALAINNHSIWLWGKKIPMVYTLSAILSWAMALPMETTLWKSIIIANNIEPLSFLNELPTTTTTVNSKLWHLKPTVPNNHICWEFSDFI